MEHNPFITLNDQTEMTYSDIKRNEYGEYVTLYFETPNKDGFSSAQCDYPYGSLENIKNYSDEQIVTIQELVDRTGKYALKYAREDEFCQVL